MPEEELGSQSPVSYEEDFEDLSSNADLYAFNDQMAQGYRGVNVNTRDDEESVGETHMKDYVDASNQENVAPPLLLTSSITSTILAKGAAQRKSSIYPVAIPLLDCGELGSHNKSATL